MYYIISLRAYHHRCSYYYYHYYYYYYYSFFVIFILIHFLRLWDVTNEIILLNYRPVIPHNQHHLAMIMKSAP